MPEITEQDRQAAEDAWRELANGQFCFLDAYSRDVIAAVIADAIAQAREEGKAAGLAATEAACSILRDAVIEAHEAGRREGLQEAKKIVSAELELIESHEGTDKYWGSLGTNAARDCAESILRALLPAPTATETGMNEKLCEWCGTPLKNCTNEAEIEPGQWQCVGYCSKCEMRTWSKPGNANNDENEGETP